MARYEDKLSRAGAESLVRKIRRYWGLKGKAVEVWVEAIESPDKKAGAVHIVRSNLRNGVPV